jgi:hypothetical protein
MNTIDTGVHPVGVVAPPQGPGTRSARTAASPTSTPARMRDFDRHRARCR